MSPPVVKLSSRNGMDPPEAATKALNLTGANNESSEVYNVNTISEDSKLVLIILYSFSVSAAIIGNILAIVIFSRGHRSRTDLRPFLINLAIADLIMAIFCIPFTFTLELLQTWVFTAPMCPIVLFLQLVSVTGSVSTNMAIGIDRLWAVAYPLKSRLTHSRYKLTIAIIWGIAVCLSSVQLVVGRVKNDRINGVDIVRCSEEWPEPSDMLMKLYTMFILFITYIVPLTILTITYTIVGRLLSQRQTPGNADEFRDTQQLRSKRKVVKMLITIVLVFGLCWLPLHIFMLLIHFSPGMLTYMSQSADLERLLQGIYFSVHWLAMSNSFVNPIIYGSMNESFRADLRCLLIGVFPCLEKCCGRKYTFATLSSRRRLPDSNSSGQKMLEKNTTVRLLASRARPHGSRQNYITNGNCIHPKGAFLDKTDQAVLEEPEERR